MRAVRAGAEGVAVVAVPAPEPDDATGRTARVRVGSASICGSDLHLATMGLPVTLGHEFAGTLDDGTVVAVEPYVPCGQCDPCRADLVHLCRAAGNKLHGISIDGGLADEVYVDPRCLLPLPAGVAVADACLVEPVAVAVHALNAAAVGDGQRVLVVGGGSIGLAVAAVAGHLGAAVDVVARHDPQRRAADELGASVVEEAAAARGRYEVVVDAAGTQSAVDLAVAAVRPGGPIAAVATYWSPVQIDTRLLMKEATLIPSFTYGRHRGEREFAAAGDVLAARPDVVEVLVTHRLGLDDAREAFTVAADRAAGAIKVVLIP